MTVAASIYEYARQGLEQRSASTALWFYGRSMSYGMLFQATEHVAYHLAALGVKHGTVVTIHLPNCPQAVMAVYAAAKLGAICSMVHPLVPEEALQGTMRATGSSVLITSRQTVWHDVHSITLVRADLSAHMRSIERAAFCLRNDNKLRNGFCFENFEHPSIGAEAPPFSTMPTDPAFYLHSSGTTGLPKTVVLSHQAVNAWVDNAKSFFRPGGLENDCLLAALPMFHGSGLVMNIHQMLSRGGTLVLVARWDAKAAVRMIRKHNVTILTGVPTLFQSLLTIPEFSGAAGGRVHSCFVSGDRVDDTLKHKIDTALGGGRHLFEGYGMTEIVTACFSCYVGHDRLSASGWPLPNCKIAVWHDGQPFQYGEGELVVHTNTMMLEYLGDEKATAAAFFDWNGEQWMHTGDYGAVGEDGFVYFRERVKNTIIRNGYNIFPAEIEHAINTVDGVREVCVVGTPEESGTQAVRACVVMSTDVQNYGEVKEAIRRACARALPRYAVPSQIYVLACLPRNNMGKIDRRALENLP